MLLGRGFLHAQGMPLLVIEPKERGKLIPLYPASRVLAARPGWQHCDDWSVYGVGKRGNPPVRRRKLASIIAAQKNELVGPAGEQPGASVGAEGRIGHRGVARLPGAWHGRIGHRGVARLVGARHAPSDDLSRGQDLVDLESVAVQEKDSSFGVRLKELERLLVTSRRVARQALERNAGDRWVFSRSFADG